MQQSWPPAVVPGGVAWTVDSAVVVVVVTVVNVVPGGVAWTVDSAVVVVVVVVVTSLRQ